jgi:hypothetical protein
MLIVTPTRRGYKPPGRSGRPELLPSVHRVCGTSDREIGWGYVKQVEFAGDDRWSPGSGLGRSERPVSIKDRCLWGRCDDSAVGEVGGATLSVRCAGGTG